MTPPPSAPYRHEALAWRTGVTLVAGVDEAGRGPLAGPVVAGAVIIAADRRIKGLADSKVLTPEQRDALFAVIHERAVAVGVGIVDHATIDAAATEAQRASPSTRFFCGQGRSRRATKSVMTKSGATASRASASAIASFVACRMLMRSIVS